MDLLQTIGLILLGILIVTGIIRNIFSPWNGVLNFIVDLFWLDLLFEALGWVIESISDIWD